MGAALCDGITSSDAIVIRPIKAIYSHFLLLYLSSDSFVALASQTVKEGSKMPRADWNFLIKQNLIVPSPKLLKEFAEYIEPTLQQLKELSFYNKKLEEARNLLLPRVMNGDIAV